ncbi:MAG: sensor histidine kinase KdpD [Firmicutes bacterium]|nr:sensor histidine kinase KdpD [Bacillota bacterium]
MGKLTVFLGAVAGVGKTYAMLEAAHDRLAAGKDVMVGWVETHGRRETEALLEGLPVISPQRTIYRDKTFAEMDLDAILNRHPQIVLVDELAHTNVPGSRHLRRYQDVEELLAAGISVFTTLNIQHLESLNDILAQITGVRVKETVPDQILERADQIHLLDVPPEELIQRLKDGKVYVPELVGKALNNFFRPGNINALRELALRQTAQRVDQQMDEYRQRQGIMTSWPAGERVLACISASPFGPRVLRVARRMAANLKAEMLVVYVEYPGNAPQTTKIKNDLAQNLRLAEELGAKVIVINGSNVAEEILKVASQNNVAQIVLGKPLRSRWKELREGSVVDQIIRGSKGVSVHVIPGTIEPQEKIAPIPRARQEIKMLTYLQVLIQVVFITVVGKVAGNALDLTNLAMLYLLPVLYAAARLGMAPSVWAALSGVLAFDIFFVPPIYRLTVYDLRYLLTFGVFLLVATFTGSMATRLRFQAEAAQKREIQTRSLYNLSRELTAVTDLDELIEKVVDQVAQTIAGDTIIFLPEADGSLAIRAASNPNGNLQVDANEQAVAAWVYQHGQLAGAGTETLPGASGIYLPLRSEKEILGVIGTELGEREKYLLPEQRNLLEALASLAALAIARLKLAGEAQKVRNLEESEKLSTTLFNSISHDLRTPLSTIIGAVTSLQEGEDIYTLEQRKSLLQNIKQGALRMNRLVSNLLDMARLESGFIKMHLEWCDVQDIIGVVLRQYQGLWDARPIKVEIPPDLPLVEVDSGLIEQVFTNLLDNAIKYSPAESQVTIIVEKLEWEIRITVADQGQGLPPEHEDQVFDKFYRMHSPGYVSGTGLGLSICKSIVAAHKGRIWAENRPGGGELFIFTLPLQEQPAVSPANEKRGDESGD